MQRIPVPTQIAPAAQNLLDAVHSKLGFTPNLYQTLAQSPAALGGLLSLGDQLSKGVLSARLREQIALVVAEENQCDYCLSAHTAIGGLLKLDATELTANRRAHSSDPKVAAALRFALAVTQQRGRVTDQDLAAVREAGLSDAEITEIIAHVAMNVLTNYFNNVARTVVDFPAVPALLMK